MVWTMFRLSKKRTVVLPWQGKWCCQEYCKCGSSDSNFAAMPEIVNQGRRVVNNIRTAASMFLIKTIFSVLLSLITIFRDYYPFEPIQMSLDQCLCSWYPYISSNSGENNYEKIGPPSCDMCLWMPSGCSYHYRMCIYCNVGMSECIPSLIWCWIQPVVPCYRMELYGCVKDSICAVEPLSKGNSFTVACRWSFRAVGCSGRIFWHWAHWSLAWSFWYFCLWRFRRFPSKWSQTGSGIFTEVTG